MFAKFGSYHMFFFLPKKVYATLKFKQTKTSQNRNNQDIFLEIEFLKKNENENAQEEAVMAFMFCLLLNSMMKLCLETK